MMADGTQPAALGQRLGRTLVGMPRTFVLTDDLLHDVERAAASSGRTVSRFVEDAVRAAVVAQHQARPGHRAYQVDPVDGNGTRRGVDLIDGAALADLMDAHPA
jgi:hypothetical protein